MTDLTQSPLQIIEQNLADCRQTVQRWLADPQLIPSSADAQQLSRQLTALTTLPLQLETAQGPVSVALATLTSSDTARLPSALSQRLTLLQAQITLFQQDLERFIQRLALLEAEQNTQPLH